MQLHYEVHASWNHIIQIFRIYLFIYLVTLKFNKKNVFSYTKVTRKKKVSISHKLVFPLIFECVLAIKLTVKWLLDY